MAEVKGSRILSSTVALEGSKPRGVDIRPLFTDRGPDEMAKNLFRLLYRLGVKATDICQITVSKYEGVASVHVRTAECESYLVAIFQDPASIMNQYDLRRITRDPRKLIVTKLSKQGQRCKDSYFQSQSGLKPSTLGGKIKAEEGAIPASETHQDKFDASIPFGLTEQYNESIQATESSATSLSYSQYSFEQLESELEESKKNNPFNDVATSTTDFSRLWRKRKGQQNEIEDSEPRDPNHRAVSLDRKEDLATVRCLGHSIDKINNTNNAPEVKITQRSVCPTRICSSSPHSPKSENVESLQPLSEAIRFSSIKTTKPRTLPSDHELQNVSNSQSTPPLESTSQAVIKIDTKTSTPAMAPCGCPETIFYHLHQDIGTETRHSEFKMGGYLHRERWFCNMLGKYMCAFLNSEGGTLYFGVDDNGKVVGIWMDASFQQYLRECVDFAVKSLLRPTPDQSQYSVNFARVMEPSGQLSEQLQVLEVCVKPRRPPRGKQYSCNNVVYLRRDGSVQAVSREDPPPRKEAPGPSRAPYRRY